MSKRLGTVAPRERVGAQTGAHYEFQYGEAALACLELLTQGTDACVYCEWHDDYVVERSSGPPTEDFEAYVRELRKLAAQYPERIQLVISLSSAMPLAKNEVQWDPSFPGERHPWFLGPAAAPT